MRPDRRAAGFTLIELVIAVAVVAILAALAVPTLGRWAMNERLSAAARAVDGAVAFARSEAIRTGNVHLVFVGLDAGGNTLVGPGGNPVDLLVVNDGVPGSANQNCAIDGGEESLGVSLERDVSWGVSLAGGPVPTDVGAAAISGPSTLLTTANNPATWLMFRPEGTPLRFNPDCTTSAVGTGGGGIYLTNSMRDKAVLVTPLGTTRIHSLADGANWSS